MLDSLLDSCDLSDLSVLERIEFGLCLASFQFENDKVAQLRSSCFEGFGIADLVRKRVRDVSENDFIFLITKWAMKEGEEDITTAKVREIGEYVANQIPRRLVRFGGGEMQKEGVEETDSVSYLDEGGSVWKTAELKMKRPSSGHAVVRIGSYIFIIGCDRLQNPTRVEVHRLDLKDLTWTECTPMMTVKHSFTCSSFAKDGKTFIMTVGGRNWLDDSVASVELFDVANQVWDNGPEMREARADACSVTADQDVWAIGGIRRTDRRDISTCEIFSSQTMTWRTGPEINEERIGSQAVLAGDKIYLAGGLHRRTVEYTRKKGQDSRWTLMQQRMHVERCGFGLAWFNDGIFAVGGRSSESKPPDYLFETATSTEWLGEANHTGEWTVGIPIEQAVCFFGNLVLC